MLDGVPCTTSENCYTITQNVAYHNTHGVMTKVGGYWRDYGGYYLSQYKTYWETIIANFGTWNSAANVYYKYPTTTKMNWTNANNYCASIAWRLPAAGEVGTSTTPSYVVPVVGVAYGVPPHPSGGTTVSSWTNVLYVAGVHRHWYNRTSDNPRADGDSGLTYVTCVR